VEGGVKTMGAAGNKKNKPKNKHKASYLEDDDSSKTKINQFKKK
jgi:hypothetical protein